ncbi:putative protein isoform X1 [Capsicum galapagoense]
METITTMENKTPPYFFKQEMKATMDLPSGFTKTLDKTVAEGISIVDTFRQDHDQREAGETTIRGAGDAVLPVKRCSLRQRVPLNPFVPNYYRPDGRGQGSRRGPGRPPKQRADVIYQVWRARNWKQFNGIKLQIQRRHRIRRNLLTDLSNRQSSLATFTRSPRTPSETEIRW